MHATYEDYPRMCTVQHDSEIYTYVYTYIYITMYICMVLLHAANDLIAAEYKLL